MISACISGKTAGTSLSPIPQHLFDVTPRSTPTSSIFTPTPPIEGSGESDNAPITDTHATDYQQGDLTAASHTQNSEPHQHHPYQQQTNSQPPPVSALNNGYNNEVRLSQG